MALPTTEGYNLTTSQPILFNMIIFLICTSFFQIFEMMGVGLLLGLMLAVGLYIYQRVNNPGGIQNYIYYNKLPRKLSGNKRKELEYE